MWDRSPSSVRRRSRRHRKAPEPPPQVYGPLVLKGVAGGKGREDDNRV